MSKDLIYLTLCTNYQARDVTQSLSEEGRKREGREGGREGWRQERDREGDWKEEPIEQPRASDEKANG